MESSYHSAWPIRSPQKTLLEGRKCLIVKHEGRGQQAKGLTGNLAWEPGSVVVLAFVFVTRELKIIFTCF